MHIYKRKTLLIFFKMVKNYINNCLFIFETVKAAGIEILINNF